MDNLSATNSILIFTPNQLISKSIDKLISYTKRQLYCILQWLLELAQIESCEENPNNLQIRGRQIYSKYLDTSDKKLARLF